MADFFSKLPVKGEIWEHTKTGGQYVIEGSTFNVITEQADVIYLPLYPCEWPRFNRQIAGCPKAWMTPNEDGTPRFRRVKRSAT